MTDSLENYYSGNDVWNKIVKRSESYWINSDYQKELLNKLDNNIDIAIVTFERMGDNSLEWVEKKVPALENITPLECLKSPKLILRLKVALMRMG